MAGHGQIRPFGYIENLIFEGLLHFHSGRSWIIGFPCSSNRLTNVVALVYSRSPWTSE